MRVDGVWHKWVTWVADHPFVHLGYNEVVLENNEIIDSNVFFF